MSGPGKEPAAPTSDAIRAAIDAGKGSDKVAFPDPAAAPLGTDDEAGGHPPTPEQRRMAAAAELKRPVSPPARGSSWPYIVALMFAAFCVIVMVVALM